MKQYRTKFKTYCKKTCFATNTVPESGATGSVEMDSEEASGFAVYRASRDPISS